MLDIGGGEGFFLGKMMLSGRRRGCGGVGSGIVTVSVVCSVTIAVIAWKGEGGRNWWYCFAVVNSSGVVVGDGHVAVVVVGGGYDYGCWSLELCAERGEQKKDFSVW